MKKSFRLLGIILSIVLALLLVGCGKSLEDEIIGKWKHTKDGTTIEFLEHGIGKDYNSEFKYRINEDDEEITIMGDKTSETYKVWIKNDKLHLSIITSENKNTDVFERVD